MRLRVIDNMVEMDLNRALSHSQMGTYSKCRQQYAYKYVLGLKTMARDQHIESWERMTRGILIHAGMEGGFLEGANAVEKYIREAAGGIRTEHTLSSDQKTLLVSMEVDSISVAASAIAWLKIDEWEPVVYRGAPMVEARLELPLPPWRRGWVGYADLVARHKPSGRQLVIDYKTRERFEADGADQWNRQFAMYQYALGKMGVRCDGSLLFEIKPEPPKRAPRVIREDVGSIDGVRISEDGRFRTTPTFRSQVFLEEVWADVQREATCIAAMKAQDVYRNMSSFTCSTCDFRQLCLAEANGDDVEDILRESFVLPNSLKIST